MKTVTICSEKELHDLLRKNTAYANGKNNPVTHLYATAAQSRFVYENVYGIYLARPRFVWMAVWIAVTNRECMRKRHLRYRSPCHPDSIGSLVIGGVGEKCGARDLLCDKAYLYFFDRASLPLSEVDLSQEPNEEQLLAKLAGQGYVWQMIERRGQTRRAFVPPKAEVPALVILDSWQVVAVNVPTLVPTCEAILTDSLIRELANRVSFQADLPDRAYLDE